MMSVTFGVSENMSGYIKIGKDRIFYEQSGIGETIILVHGGDCDRRMWDNQFIELSKSHKVIRYDARGFGKSDKPSENYSVYDDLDFLMEYLHIEKAILIGQCLGASTITEFCLRTCLRLIVH